MNSMSTVMVPAPGSSLPPPTSSTTVWLLFNWPIFPVDHSRLGWLPTDLPKKHLRDCWCKFFFTGGMPFLSPNNLAQHSKIRD